MKTSLEVTDREIRELVLNYIKNKLGPGAQVQDTDLLVRVRSKQNYREHKWELGELSVTFEGDI